MGFLGNQYTLSIEGYRKLTYDILMKLPVSTLYGLNAPYQNAGKVKNTGLEITAGYKLNTHGWNLQVSANAAYNKNEVMDLKNGGARIWSGKYFNRKDMPSTLSEDTLPRDFLKLKKRLLIAQRFPALIQHRATSSTVILITMEKSMEKTVSTLVTPCLSGHLA